MLPLLPGSGPRPSVSDRTLYAAFCGAIATRCPASQGRPSRDTGSSRFSFCVWRCTEAYCRAASADDFISCDRSIGDRIAAPFAAASAEPVAARSAVHFVVGGFP